jgi:predicted Zn-dependent peptidase
MRILRSLRLRAFLALAGLLGILSFIFTWWHSSAEPGDIVDIPTDRFAAVRLVPTKDDTEQVKLYLSILAGAADAGGNAAVPHYLEHLVFYNSKPGTPLGNHENAFTYPHLTTYVSVTTRDVLAQSIDLVENYLKPLKLPAEAFDREKQVVKLEFLERTASDALYEEWTGHSSRLHAMDDLKDQEEAASDFDALNATVAEDFFKRHYRAENAVLTIYGNIGAAALGRMIERSSLPILERPAELAVKPYQTSPNIRGEARIKTKGMKWDTLLWSKVFAWQSDSALARRIATTSLCYQILDSTPPGSLARPLRFDAHIASSFDMTLMWLDLKHVLFTFQGVPDTGTSLDELKTALETTLDQIISDGVPQKTFEQVKARELESLMADRSRDEGALNRALDPLLQLLPPYSHEDYIAALRDVSLEEVNRVIAGLRGAGASQITLLEKE